MIDKSKEISNEEARNVRGDLTFFYLLGGIVGGLLANLILRSIG